MYAHAFSRHSILRIHDMLFDFTMPDSRERLISSRLEESRVNTDDIASDLCHIYFYCSHGALFASLSFPLGPKCIGQVFYTRVSYGHDHASYDESASRAF